MSNIIQDLKKCQYHNKHGLKTCRSIGLIDDYINNKNELTSLVLDQFMRTLKEHYCLGNGNNYWEPTVQKYIENMNEPILSSTFKIFADVPYSIIHTIFNTIYDSNKTKIIKTVLKYHVFDNINSLINHIKFDNDNMCLILQNRKICTSECKYLLKFRSVTSKQNLSPDALIHFFQNDRQKDNTELLDLLLFIGCEIDENTICFLCENAKYDVLRRLINNIEITDKMYAAALKIYKYDKYECGVLRALVLDVLIDKNFKITQSHINDSITKDYYINNIEKHLTDNNMTHTDVYNLQKNLGHPLHPYISVDNIMIPNLLYYATRSGKNLQFVMQVIATTNIKPTVDFLEDICNLSGHSDRIQYILNTYKLPVTKKCLINSNNISDNRTLSVLISKLPDGIIQSMNDKVVENKVDPVKETVKILKLGKPSRFPKSTKTKNKVSDESVKLLKLKSDMLTFIDLKKRVLDYVKSNFLLENNYIKINKDLSNLIDIEENSCIQFADFDNIVAYFIENQI